MTHPKLLTFLTLSQSCPKSLTRARESKLSRYSLTLRARVLRVSLQGKRRGAELTSVFCAKLLAPSIGASAVKRQLIAVGRRVRMLLSFQCGIVQRAFFCGDSDSKARQENSNGETEFFFLQKTLRAVLLDWRLRVLIIIASFFFFTCTRRSVIDGRKICTWRVKSVSLCERKVYEFILFTASVISRRKVKICAIL